MQEDGYIFYAVLMSKTSHPNNVNPRNFLLTHTICTFVSMGLSNAVWQMINLSRTA